MYKLETLKDSRSLLPKDNSFKTREEALVKANQLENEEGSYNIFSIVEDK